MDYSLNQLTLISLLEKHLAMNLARLKCLSQILLALIEVRCASLAKLAGFLQSNATPESRYRRLQRFMKEVNFVPQKLACLLLEIMEIKTQEKLTLILDRTNWKFGKKDCNILYLAVAYHGTAIPLFGLF
jgi:hypothetical protein